MLKATAITKKYGNLSILKGVDFSIEKGEMVSIIGSSGAGKSTLLHILGTLDTPDSGSIEMLGQNLLKNKQIDKFRNQHIGFVFQFHHLLPEFTALENVSIPGWIAKRNKKEIENSGIALLEMLQLKDRMHHKPSQLSGGEQQRVAIARALINKPDIVFADEPTGNLDSTNAAALHQIFIDLQKNTGQTFLIVTHNEALAYKSNRVLKMKDGVFV
jgi:lipoprotein-releasing system ATP-binding protein